MESGLLSESGSYPIEPLLTCRSAETITDLLRVVFSGKKRKTKAKIKQPFLVTFLR